MFWIWFLPILAGVALLGLIALTLWGRWIRMVSHEVVISRLPKEFDGFRISLISDLHDRRFGDRNQRLISAVLATNPDLVVTAGDLHEDPHSPQPVYDLFAGLSASVPVTYTEGNHDLRKGRRSVTEERHQEHLKNIAEAGAILLNDTVFPLERNGEHLLLYGISWRGMAKGEAPAFSPEIPIVTVCHDPLHFDKIDPLPDLMLSGHVHGGILRLPFLGPVFAPGNGLPLRKRFGRQFFFPKYSRGLYHKGNSSLAVTQGLGFSILPIRFIRPEIMVLTLKSEEKLNNS